MRLASCLPRRRNAFTLIELLIVIALTLVIAALGLGYIVFGQDNQHSVAGAQAVMGALLNAKQRAKRDGLPTGVRIIFGPTVQSPSLTASQASQLELVQQPEDYTAGTCTTSGNTVVTFSGVDFLAGAPALGAIDQAPVEPGDYFLLIGTQTVHQITGISGTGTSPTITLASSVGVNTSSTPSGAFYSIIRAPRRLPSEDIIQLPATVVIDDATAPGSSGFNYSQNFPTPRTLTNSFNPSVPNSVTDIVFAPSGAVVGQGTGADKIYLWLRDPNPKLTPVATQPLPGVPLILSIQIRTGLMGVYGVAPWAVGTPINTAASNDPYAYVKDPRSAPP